MEVPGELIVPAISACYRYTDIIIYDRLNERNGTSFKFNMTEEELDELKKMLTLKDIFEMTPNEEEAFTRCRSKVPQSYEVEHGNNSKECLAMFKVSKFFFVEFVCYRYEYQLKPDVYTFDELANTPKLSGVMYEITPGKLFDSYQFVKFISHTTNVYPAQAIGFAPLMYRGDKWQTAEVNAATYMVTSFKLTKVRLPPPRVTMCQDYNTTIGMRSKEVCKQECRKKKAIENLEKIPFASIQSEAVDLKVVSYLESLTEEVRFKSFQYYNECNVICKRDDCVQFITFNRISDSPNSELRFRVMIPIEPWQRC